MRKSDSLKKTMMFFGRRSIIVLMGCCFAVTWGLYYSKVILNPYFHKGNWAFVALYFFMYYVLTSFYGGFRIGSQRLTDTVYANILSIIMVNFITYFQIALVGRGFFSVYPLLATTAIQIGLIFAWALCVTKFYFSIFQPVRLICLYDGKYPRHVVETFSAINDKFQILNVIQFTAQSTCGGEMLSGADGVIISGIPDEKYPGVLKFCLEHSLRYYLVPNISDILVRTSELIYLTDIPLFMAKNEGLYFGQKITKRILDIVGSIFFIILFSPLMIAIAAAIKINDGGSILYRQKRCTLHGRTFDILKFRSMKENAESDGKARLASEDDPRITPVGRVLRKYRLDELPQLFNILWGDMSFVGPRPERPAIIKEYKKTLPEFDYRLNVKCGLTGYAQVIGRYNTSPADKLKLDLIYIQTYSLLLDLKIILMTIKAIFSKESAEGVDKSCGERV